MSRRHNSVDQHRFMRAAALACSGLPAVVMWSTLAIYPTDASAPAAVRRLTDWAGASVVGVLQRLASIETEQVALQREIAVAAAGPRAARRIVLWMPAVAVMLTAVLGFNTIPVLFGTWYGWVLLSASGALVLAGQRWSRRLIAQACAEHPSPLIALTLIASLLRSGISLAQCVSAVCTEPSLTQGHPDQVRQAITDAETQAERWGAPVAALIEARADELGAENRAQRLTAVHALAEKLLLPLGACVLPAFLLVAVIPAVLSILSSTVAGIGGFSLPLPIGG